MGKSLLSDRCVDRYTRWPEAFPTENIKAETVARTFIGLGSSFRHICPRHHRPGQAIRVSAVPPHERNTRIAAYKDYDVPSSRERNGRTIPSTKKSCDKMPRRRSLERHLTDDPAGHSRSLPRRSTRVRSRISVRRDNTFAGRILRGNKENNAEPASMFRKLREAFKRIRPTEGTRHRKSFIF